MPSDYDSPRGGRSRGTGQDQGLDFNDDYESREPRGKDAAQPKSILRDPSEGASRRKPRSNSQVRIRTAYSDDDSDGSVDGRYVRHRDGRVEFVPEGGSGGRSGKRPVDLEKKTAPRNRDFRDKRDGYESDEGEMLRGAKRADPRSSRRAHPDEDESYGRDTDPARRPRDRRPDDPPSGGRRSYDEDDDRRRPARPRHDRNEDRGYASERGKSLRFDRDDGWGRDARRRPDPYRSDARRPRTSDAAPRGKHDNDPYSDRRGDRGGLQRSRSERVTRDKYGDPVRGSDRRGRDDPRGGSKGGNQDWKKQAGAMFMTQAMPVIRREGTKFVKKELESYLAGKGR